MNKAFLCVDVRGGVTTDMMGGGLARGVGRVAGRMGGSGPAGERRGPSATHAVGILVLPASPLWWLVGRSGTDHT